MKGKNNFDLHLSLWESELAKTYDMINWTYKLKLVRPQFQVVDVTSFWGQWNPSDRKIKIALRLIQNHSWDVVKNILKHEMAHQMDSEVFNGVGDHGNSFKRACNQMGLPLEFQNSALDSGSPIFNWKDESTYDSATSENHDLIRKVEKLLSLAQSANENEAVAAMEKVMKLYQTYNLDRIEKNIKLNYVYSIINFKKQRIESYQLSICNVLQEFYFVDVVFSRLYDAHSCKSHQVIELFGSKENVQMAEYVFHFLNNKVLSMWQDHAKVNKLPIRFKRSYLIGVVRGFREKLRIINENSSKALENKALIVHSTKDKNLTLFVRTRYPILSSGRGSSSGVYSEAFESGRTHGKSIVISKGISSATNSLKKFFLS